jgi:hypothetical protein
MSVLVEALLRLFVQLTFFQPHVVFSVPNQKGNSTLSESIKFRAIFFALVIMSRQPSPGPSQPQAGGQVFQAPPPPPTRHKSKTFIPGIAAGAEDVKYQAKYKELKRKVKEIEAVSADTQFCYGQNSYNYSRTMISCNSRFCRQRRASIE